MWIIMIMIHTKTRRRHKRGLEQIEEKGIESNCKRTIVIAIS
jgi:hypothetical protein